MSIYTDDTVKRLRFFYGDIEITEYVIPKSLKIQDYLCTGQLNFGETNSANAQFKTSEDLQLTEKRILITFGTDEESEPVGTYKVKHSSHKTNTDEVEITAYDAVKEFDKDISDWYNSLSWPISLSDFRKSLCAYIGIESVNVTLINDNIQLYETIAPSSLNGIEMLFYIGQLNGVFPHATKDYKLDWVSLGTDTKTITKNVTYGQYAYEAKSYITAPIGGLVIRQEDGDIGASVGKTNKYVIQGNVLVYGCSSTELTSIAERIYEKIKNIQYVPCSIKMKYLPDISMGYKCEYDGAVFYVLQRATSGILFDKITADGNKYLESDNSIESKIEQLRGKSNVLNRSIEENRLTITNLESDLNDISQETSELKQTSSEIKASVSTLEKRIDQEVETVEVDYEPTLYNYPAMDWCTNIPVDGTIPVTDDLHFIYTDEDYRNHLGYVAYGVETNTMYRFTKDSDTGTYYWKPVVNSDMSYVMEKVSELAITVDGIETNVAATYETKDGAQEEYKRLESSIKETAESITSSVSATYQTKDAMSGYATITEMSSLFEQTAEAISFTVKKDDIISSINQTAESVTIKAGKIDLEGLVTSTEFVTKFATIDSLSAVNANVMNLETGMVSISGALSATEARIGKIETNYVSTDFLLVNGKIKADLLDAQVINSKIATISEVNLQRLSCNSYRTSFNNRDYILSPISIQTSSGYYVVLGAKQVMSASLSLSE